MFTAIERDHLAALAVHAAALDRALSPPLASLHGSAATQPGERDLFTAARRLERSVSVLFGSAEADSGASELPSRVLSDLALVQSLARRQLAALAPPASPRD
jgi:hypothetical protein